MSEEQGKKGSYIAEGGGYERKTRYIETRITRDGAETASGSSTGAMVTTGVPPVVQSRPTRTSPSRVWSPPPPVPAV